MIGSQGYPLASDLEEARALQRRLAASVVESDQLDEIHYVGGIDLSGAKSTGTATAAAVLLSFPTLELVEEHRVEGPLVFPYISGYLSFREAPLMIQALRGLRQKPDLILVDGQGRAHPRRLGIACHLGLLLDVPTIGCAKSRLVGMFDDLPEEAGAWTPLVDKGEVIGNVVRTKRGVKPIFVSLGHRVSLGTATRLVLQCTRPNQRIPEPTRQAHFLAGQQKTDKGEILI
jgi:deoxyribonuclease V